MLYFAGRHGEAIGALSRAARWGTTDKPLYRGQLVLARLSAGEPADTIGHVGAARERLEEAPCGQGYGQFVLGELAYHEGDWLAAERYLTAFLRRTSGGRVALEVALAAEIARSRRLIRQIRQQRRRSAG